MFTFGTRWLEVKIITVISVIEIVIAFKIIRHSFR